MEKKEYISNLKKYVQEKGITIHEYYKSLAYKIRTMSDLVITDWERQNPFITDEDLDTIIKSSSDDICEDFATTMTQVISMNEELFKKEALVPRAETELPRKNIEKVISEEMKRKELSRKQIEDIITETMTKKEDFSKGTVKRIISDELGKIGKINIVMENIERSIADGMNGFAVVKESKTGRVHLYYHDADKKSLKGKTTFYQDQLKVESGYYINYDEYMNQIVKSMIQKYPNIKDLRFVRDDGLERTLAEVSEEAFAIARKEGALRFGTALLGKKITSYHDYRSKRKEETEEFANESMQTGFYVRRDVLARIFNKYKMKLTLEHTEDLIKSGKQK